MAVLLQGQVSRLHWQTKAIAACHHRDWPALVVPSQGRAACKQSVTRYGQCLGVLLFHGSGWPGGIGLCRCNAAVHDDPGKSCMGACSSRASSPTHVSQVLYACSHSWGWKARPSSVALLSSAGAMVARRLCMPGVALSSVVSSAVVNPGTCCWSTITCATKCSSIMIGFGWTMTISTWLAGK